MNLGVKKVLQELKHLLVYSPLQFNTQKHKTVTQV